MGEGMPTKSSHQKEDFFLKGERLYKWKKWLQKRHRDRSKEVEWRNIKQIVSSFSGKAVVGSRKNWGQEM